jgi:O-antigen/teichoic acid export membrane protein
MGIIARQSFFNSISIAFAFLIGAVNTVFLYPTYMGSEYQGLIVALLALSNLVQPFISFGVQHALIKFYSTCKTKEERDRLLSLSITLPLIMFSLIVIVSLVFKVEIIAFISSKNSAIGKYAFLIIAVAFSTAMFEVFYNWLRIQLHSVFGNFLKEFYPRALIFLLLLIYAFGELNLEGFITALIIGYYMRLILVIIYTLIKYTPKFSFKLPIQFKPIFRYSILIFMSGTAASLILDIDKSMISNVLTIENVAYYSVAVFIASVIEFPGRAMFQIISPLVAKALNENDDMRLLSLLKKSANNLLISSGLLFLLINLNLNDFYNWVNLTGYTKALDVVFIISFGKLFSMSMGCLNNIITNSKYYHYVFWFSTASAVLAVLLNIYFIQLYGIIGAAYATLIVIVLINLMKILLVQLTFKINPFGKKTILILLAIFGVYLIFSYLNFDFSPFISIILRSLLIGLVFTLISYLLKLTGDFQDFLYNFLIFKKKP